MQEAAFSNSGQKMTQTQAVTKVVGMEKKEVIQTSSKRKVDI